MLINFECLLCYALWWRDFTLSLLRLDTLSIHLIFLLSSHPSFLLPPAFPLPTNTYLSIIPPLPFPFSIFPCQYRDLIFPLLHHAMPSQISIITIAISISATVFLECPCFALIPCSVCLGNFQIPAHVHCLLVSAFDGKGFGHVRYLGASPSPMMFSPRDCLTPWQPTYLHLFERKSYIGKVAAPPPSKIKE